MRLDKYLKVSRLIKRRTVANEACDAGKVTVNGKPARAQPCTPPCHNSGGASVYMLITILRR